MDIQQTEAHFDAVDLARMQPGGDLHFTAEEVSASPATVITKICGVYQIIRPFIDWASRFFLMPKKIKTILTTFLSVMDTVCTAQAA